MPRQVDHEERRRELTGALLRIAGTRGLQAVSMREVAAEAGVSLRVVQYYFADKRTLMAAGFRELVARLDRRVRERAAARAPALTRRDVVEIVLTSILPTDEPARLDQLAWTAYHAAGLTADWAADVREEGLAGPDALEAYLVGVLTRAREDGEVDADRDPRAEVVALLAMVNGLTSSVLAGQRGVDDAVAVLRYRLERLFDPTPGARSPAARSRTVGGAEQGEDMADDRQILPGSDRRPTAQSRPAGRPDSGTRVDITLVLRRRGQLPAPGARPLTREELADVAGADPDDVELVRSTLAAEGVEVTSVDPASRRVQARADVATLERVFGTTLELVESPAPDGTGTVTHRQRTGELSVPGALADVVVAVLGLDDRPQARVRFRPAPASARSYTPPQLGQVYRFPAGTTGAGQTLAILELGGGYAEADLTAYWSRIGLSTPPTVTSAGVDGAANAPEGNPNGADGEVLLDIEVAGALAYGAHLVVYFAPNTDRGFLDALTTATQADPTPAAVSISWGQSEDEWTAQARTAMDQAMADAGALGVTVCVASGDDGSTDNATDGGAHVDFPASSPNALGCGGTTLDADPATGAVSSETVWYHGAGQGGSGGGVSDVFPVPTWQSSVGVPGDADTGRSGRGVPDVAGDADPATGYQVRVDGTDTVIGGTSAVAPLWAALVCRLAEGLGRRPGPLQPQLYAGAAAGQAVPGFRDITSGSNGAYSAGPGWDPCTGLGVPDGEALLTRLRGAAG